MNLLNIRPGNDTEVLLLSITKNCETLIKRTHTRQEETLEFKLTKSREAFHFNPLISAEGSWMIGLTSLEVLNSIFNKTQQNKNFKLYKSLDERNAGVLYEKVRDEIGKDLGVSDITPADLQDDIIAPINFEEYREEVAKRMKNGGYMNILAEYHSSIFPDFESYLRTENDLVEDDN